MRRDALMRKSKGSSKQRAAFNRISRVRCASSKTREGAAVVYFRQRVKQHWRVECLYIVHLNSR